MLENAHEHSDSTMLLATHSADKQLRLYRVGVDFQQMMFNIQHVKTINNCSPLDYEGSSSSSKPCQISHLEFIPPGPETRNREAKNAFILAVFSQENSQDPTLHEEPFSIISKWELHSTKPMLHPSFEQLTLKKSSASASGNLLVRSTFWCSNVQSLIKFISPRLLSRGSQTF